MQPLVVNPGHTMIDTAGEIRKAVQMAASARSDVRASTQELWVLLWASATTYRGTLWGLFQRFFSRESKFFQWIWIPLIKILLRSKMAAETERLLQVTSLSVSRFGAQWTILWWTYRILAPSEGEWPATLSDKIAGRCDLGHAILRKINKPASKTVEYLKKQC